MRSPAYGVFLWPVCGVKGWFEERHCVEKTQAFSGVRALREESEVHVRKFNTRIAKDGAGGGHALRVWFKKAGKRKAPGYLVKCGCCNERLEISMLANDLLEINGVLASRAEWRKFLLPLLEDRA